MANKNIKGLTVEIGGDTTKLGKALEDVTKKSSSLTGELGEINKMLKFDPKNTELLAQKQKVLAEAISNTGKKLDTLKEAEKQVQAQFERGEVSEEQVRALQREIIATEKKMDSYERAVKETQDALDQLSKDADDAADGIEDVGKESKDAADDAEDLGNALSTGLAVGLGAVVAGCAAAVSAIAGSVEATQEYRREMGKLDTAFTQNGHSSEAATKTYEALQGVLGETDQAVEAANHLSKLTDNEKDLQKWTDICTGVYAQFGASLPIEGLTEAANETAKTGALTGSLADALNWAGVSEDDFQAKLDKCNNEQERQVLITETLNDLYADMADAYRETNEEVIRSNKATERLNKVWADVGKKAAPTVNTFREGVAELGESFVALIEDVDLREFNLNVKKGFKDIADNVLPKLINSLEWCAENFDAIKSVAIGAATSVVAYKVAVLAAEIAQNGLLKTIKATTVAQTALNLVQKATPWGLAATAITGVVVALTAYSTMAKAAARDTDALTIEERELMQAASEATDKFREQQVATAENIAGISSQMGHVQSLAAELQTLADKTGKVNETDQARVQFILGELNEALGTEYTMVDGVVQKYGELKKNIDGVIQSKTANALLEAGNADYVLALQNETQAWENLKLAEKDHEAQLEVVKQKEEELAAARSTLAGNATRENAMRVYHLQGDLETEKVILGEKKAAYDQAAVDYGTYSTTINNYEDAQAAALEGNYQKAMDLLQGKSEGYSQHADVVDQETKRVLDSLYKEAVDAGIAAENTKQNFENGVTGYTQEMVDEANKGYEEALAAYGDAYADAKGVGEDMGGGLADGLENKRTSVLGKIRSIVSAAISAARKEADSHSPSKKMIAFGEDMGEGAAIGLENKTKDVVRTARDQVQQTMDAYRQPVPQMLTPTRSSSSEDAARALFDNAELVAKLDGIYERLGRLQMVTQTGALVAEIIDDVDAQLSGRQRLVARGVF